MEISSFHFLLSLYLCVLGFVSYQGVKVVVKKYPQVFQRNWFLHPNAVTLIRIPLILIACFLYTKGEIVLGSTFLLLGIISDAFDGMIARGCHLETKLGRVLDPLVDKASYFLMFLFFLALFWNEQILMLYGLFFLIDIGNQSSRLIARIPHLEQKSQGKANMFGKIKTSIAFALILLLYMVSSSLSYEMTLSILFFGGILLNIFGSLSLLKHILSYRYV